MRFSERGWVDDRFREYTREKGLAYTVANFMAWLQGEQPEAKAALKKLGSLGRVTDGELVYELEIRGFPEELTKPLRDFLSQPVADRNRLEAWNRSVEARP